MITLGDLLDQPDFALKLLTVDAQARQQPIHGAHSIEISHPTRWLAEHWVMLTTGVRLRGRPLEQRRLIAELADGGIAALGFGVAAVSKQVPPALLEEADKRSFPVFAVPAPLPFREIVAFVNRSLLSSDLYVLQRVISVQDYLMDAFHADPPEPVLITRLASVLPGVEVALVESDGRVTAETGPLAAAAYKHVRRTSRMHELEHEGRWGVAARVQRPNQANAWLIVLSADGESHRELVKPVSRAAARLLGLPTLARDSSSWRRRRRRRLAEVLYDAPEQSTRPSFANALADAGIDMATPCRAVAFTRRSRQTDPGSGQDALLRRIEDLLDQHQVAHVSAERDGIILTLAQDDLTNLNAWLAEITDTHDEVYAGISEQITTLAGASKALTNARVTLTNLPDAPGQSRVLHFEALDAITFLLASLPGAHEHNRLADELHPLQNEPRLLQTLQTYFKSNLAIPLTAQTLGIHPNSLRYRLTRIEELLKASLTSPQTIATLHIALHDQQLPHQDQADTHTHTGEAIAEAAPPPRRASRR